MSQPQRVVLRNGGLIGGALLSHLYFCTLVGLLTGIIFPSSMLSGLPGALLTLFYGTIPSILIGWALGWLLAFTLRPITSQWLHVLAFGALGGALYLAYATVTGSYLIWWLAAPLILAIALGRLSVWKLATTSDASPEQYDRWPA